MKLYSVGEKGGLKKVNEANFGQEDAYLIDDYKTIYLWFGQNVPKIRINLVIEKARSLIVNREKPTNLQIIYQNKEYGAFLAMMDFLRKGIKSSNYLEKRPELEIEYEETIELIEAGINPDLEAEITVSAHELLQEGKTYEDLCKMLAEIQLKSTKKKGKITEKEIKKKADEIYESSATYEELCWLIAELNKLLEKEKSK